MLADMTQATVVDCKGTAIVSGSLIRYYPSCAIGYTTKNNNILRWVSNDLLIGSISKLFNAGKYFLRHPRPEIRLNLERLKTVMLLKIAGKLWLSGSFPGCHFGEKV